MSASTCVGKHGLGELSLCQLVNTPESPEGKGKASAQERQEGSRDRWRPRPGPAGAARVQECTLSLQLRLAWMRGTVQVHGAAQTGRTCACRGMLEGGQVCAWEGPVSPLRQLLFCRLVARYQKRSWL